MKIMNLLELFVTIKKYEKVKFNYFYTFGFIRLIGKFYIEKYLLFVI